MSDLTLGQGIILIALFGLAAVTFIRYCIQRSNDEDSFPMRQCHFCMEVAKETIEVRKGRETRDACPDCLSGKASFAGFEIS